MKGKLLDVRAGTRLRDRDKRSGIRIVEVVEVGLPDGRVMADRYLRGPRMLAGRPTRITPTSARWEVVS